MESVCCISLKKTFWEVDWYHSEHVEKYTLYIERKEREKLYIYNDKILKGTQDVYREADTPYKMPVSCSLGLRCYPVLTQVWIGLRENYSQATQINKA